MIDISMYKLRNLHEFSIVNSVGIHHLVGYLKFQFALLPLYLLLFPFVRLFLFRVSSLPVALPGGLFVAIYYIYLSLSLAVLVVAVSLSHCATLCGTIFCLVHIWGDDGSRRTKNNCAALIKKLNLPILCERPGGVSRAIDRLGRQAVQAGRQFIDLKSDFGVNL